MRPQLHGWPALVPDALLSAGSMRGAALSPQPPMGDGLA